MTGKNILTAIAFVASFCIVWSLGHAENLVLDEIVIKGKKESTLQESLTMKEVRESPAKDIGEALQQVEGISIVRKGAIANDVVLRGLQKDNINVFMDGVRIHGACPSRMDPPAFHFDFAEVEQIKIIKGPYDLTNPGGIGGEINVVSKRPAKGFESDLSFTYGSYKAVNTSATMSYGTDVYDGLVGYAYKYSLPPSSGDGKRITEIYPSSNAGRYKPDAIDSKAYEINTGWTKLGFNPTKNSRTEISYSYQDADHVLYPYLTMDAKYDRTNLLNWDYRIEKVSPIVRELRFQAYWDKVTHLMDDRERFSSLGKPRYYSMQTDATTQVYGAKAKGSFSCGPGILAAGIDYYNRNWDAVNQMAMMKYKDTAMIPDVFTDNLGFFAGYELPVSKDLTVKGGLREDFTWTEADKSTNKPKESTDFAKLSGNIQLIWAPLKHVETTLGFGSGVRPPDPQELFINSAKQQGNPFLKAVRNNEIDLGIKYATDRFFVKAAVFNSDIKDFIALYRTGTVRGFKNINANIWGGEFSSQFALPRDFYIKGAFSYTRGQNESDSRPLSEIPPFNGLVALRYDVNTWFAELTENFAARQGRVDKALNETPTAGWATTDLRVGINYKALSVYGGIYNIFDKFYYTYLSYLRDPFASGVKVPENGRNVYITLEYKFS